MTDPISKDLLFRRVTEALEKLEKYGGNGEVNIFVRQGKPVAVWDTYRPPLHYFVAGLTDADYKEQRISIAKENHVTLDELDKARDETRKIERFVVYVKSIMDKKLVREAEADAAAARIDAFLASGEGQ